MSLTPMQKVFLTDKDIFPDIIGQTKVKEELKSALLMGRNIVILGQPGIGKTTLAKNVASVLPDLEVNDCPYHCLPKQPLCPQCQIEKHIKTKIIKGQERFIRIQGSPDLTVEDLFGDIDPVKALEFGPMSTEAFTPGKIFKANNGVLFFDELNRCPEKLQNALLQVLQEHIVTIGTYDIDFPAQFIFIATMNPHDTNTERLSDVLLDRLDMLTMTYPETAELEQEIVLGKAHKMIVTFPSHLLVYLVGFVRELRENKQLETVPSVRATIGIYERAQSTALLHNRSEVSFEDVKEVIPSVVAHRIKLKPSVRYLQSPQEFIEKALEEYTEYGLGKQALEDRSFDEQNGDSR
ncbi:MAG: ATP-binding protein [Candidatus Woesearchaeota archaeon]|jgi:Mg-chelatase subunit ChlI